MTSTPGVPPAPRPRRAAPWEKLTSEDLRIAAAGTISLAALLRALAMPDNGRTRRLLQQRVAEHDIDISHFLGQGHARGTAGPTPRKTAAELLVRHDGGRRTKTVLLRRALAEIGVPERCGECGTPPQWCGRPITLEVDHINGDPGDDRATNLRLLCPNCHAITRTWCRGGARGRKPDDEG